MKKLNPTFIMSIAAIVLSMIAFAFNIFGIPHIPQKISTPKILVENEFDVEHESFETKEFDFLYVLSKNEPSNFVNLYRSDGTFYVIRSENSQRVVFVDPRLPRPNYRSVALQDAWIFANKEIDEFADKLSPDPIILIKD